MTPLGLAFALSMSACGPGETAASQRSASGGAEKAATRSPTALIARVDPCALLTKDEIQQQVELSMPASQREGLRSKGVVWSIAMQPSPRGASRACQVTWQGNVNGESHSRGEFQVVVTFATWLTGSVAGMKTPLPIPNVGDEAYFVGGKSGPPYARIGDIAIGIENFPDTKQARSGLDLLRAAVQRARAQGGADK